MATRRINSLYDDDDEDSFPEKGFTEGKEQSTVTRAPIDKLGVSGRWLRHKLLDGILVGTPVLLTIQRHRSPIRTFIMKMISFLGTEDFYTVLFLFIFWTLDSRLGRLFGILMGIGFYTAGFLKTLLCLPRPPSPPVIPEEKAYDWALPSHHSLLGTILPWYIWLYVNVHHDLSSGQLTCVFAVIVLWSFSVLFSRLYLGVHSPADIVSGGFVGVIVLSLWLQVDDYVDDFISQQKIENPLQCVLLFIGLLYIHPSSDPGNPSFTDNCCLSGVVTGLIIGRSQRSRLLGFPSTLETWPNISLSTFTYIATLRLITGALFVFGVRTILKFIVSTTMRIVYQFLGMKFYSSSEYRKAGHSGSKHYNENFHLPPIYNKETLGMDESDEDGHPSGSQNPSTLLGERLNSFNCSGKDTSKMSEFESDVPKGTNSQQMPWDIDAPTKCILYSILTYSAIEIVPQFFNLIGL